MKHCSIYLGGKHIEIFNSLFGKESIKIDGTLVSSKFSVFGTQHEFQYQQDLYRFKFFYGISGIMMDFYLNDSAIIVSKKGGCAIIILVVILLVVIKLIFGSTH